MHIAATDATSRVDAGHALGRQQIGVNEDRQADPIDDPVTGEVAVDDRKGVGGRDAGEPVADV